MNSSENGPLKDLICLVTGTGGGIGKAIAQAFAASGALVYCNARSLASLAWTKGHPSFIPLPFDLQDAQAIREALWTIKRAGNGLDVLVNNAGVEYNELLGLISREHTEEMLSVNLLAPIELISLAARLMERKGSGSIINITSTVGRFGNPGQLVYGATKGALEAVTKTAAKELAPKGIRVNAVAPGLTQTHMLEGADQERLRERIERIPMGRMASPEDIAGACLYFASPAAAFVTGQILDVDGGSVK
ncbi:3-oxoacyl-[acyl-carrier protein] reductase [Clostridiaceae bacterium JG1575]|nr:3-oxoacyl-[acyl-carrier protein] reductase [Clostridiaceae bacterium JG1575]